MLKKLISIVLVVAMLTGMLPAALAADATKYVKEVKLDSKDKLEKAGYTVFDSDLNDGTDKGAIYLGYKTTDDPGEAITDIRALEEGKDYQLVDSDKVNAEFFVDEAMADAVTLMKIVKEYRKLYENDNLNARYAYELLQMYAYDENTRLGDYILEDATKATLSLIVLNASDDMKFGLFGALFMGFREDDAATWEQRLIDAEGDEVDESELITDARSILVPLKSFRVQMNAALEKDYGEDEQMDVTLQAAKETLESYNYGETTLYDYFMEDELTSDKLLPLVSVLSSNEIELLKFVGFANFCYLQDGDVDETKVKEAHEELKKTEEIDFWYGSISEKSGKIAITSDAIRDLSTNDEAREGSTLSDTTIGLSAAAGASLLITAILFAGSRLMQNSKALVEFSNFVKTFRPFGSSGIPSLAANLTKIQGIAKAGGAYESMGGMVMSALPDKVTKFATSTKGASMTTKELCMTRATNVSKTLSGVAKASIILTVVLCLIDLGFMIYDIATHEDVEHAEKPGRALSLEKLSDGEYGYVSYDTVKTLSGEYGDTNNNEAKKWMILLTTTDARMGTPIKADTFKLGKGDTMYDRSPIAILGQLKAADLNANAFTHKKTNYVFFERANANTLASIFKMPTLIAVVVALAAVVAAGITVPIVVSKKRKAKAQAA